MTLDRGAVRVNCRIAAGNLGTPIVGREYAIRAARFRLADVVPELLDELDRVTGELARVREQNTELRGRLNELPGD